MTDIRQPDFGAEIMALLPETIKRQVIDLALGRQEDITELQQKEERDKRIAAQTSFAYEAEEGRRRARMQRDQEAIDGNLPPDAELFRDLRLKPRIAEAHDFTPKVKTPIVQGVFFRDSLTWVAGQSGTFKSFITADLAFRYGADDMDYHGMRMTHGRSLLIIAEGAGGYADRKTAWEKEHDREVKNVSIFPAPLQLGDTLKEMPALLSYLREEDAAGRPFGLILFDTQAMCTIGVDENTSEMNLIMGVLHQIREVSGACVMTVHHFGKKKDAGMRGSSMIYAAADTVCVLTRKDDAQDVVLSTSQSDEGKQKDGEGKKNFLTLDLKAHPVGEDYFGDPVFSLVPQKIETSGHPITDDDHPTELPAISDTDLWYLKGIGTYENDGASPSALRERLNEDEWVLVRPPHKAVAQTAGNRLQGLKKKGLTEPVPGAKGKWRITLLGHSLIANTIIDRMHADQDLLARNARLGKFRGAFRPSQEGLDDLGSELGSEG